MNNQHLWIIVLSGIGTFAMRWLPLHQALRKNKQKSEHVNGLNASTTPDASDTPNAVGVSNDTGPSFLKNILAGVGAAAVAALLTVSLWGLLQNIIAPQQTLRIAAIAAGLFTVAVVRRWIKGIAAPTLLGALIYGASIHWLS